MNTIKKAVIPFVAVVAFIASWICVVQYFTPREIHAIDMVGVSQQFQQMTKDRSIDNAMRDVQYWTQHEAALRVMLQSVKPGTVTYSNLLQQIDNAMRERCAAQRHLNDLKRK